MKILRDIIARLVTAGYDAGEARAVGLLVLDECFEVSQTDLYADKVRDFSSEERQRLEIILQRLETGEPVQYCLGTALFDDMKLEVTPATLIPRPETQQLVNIVAADSPEYVLDIGTGSGCMAISLKRRLPDAHVEAWDISSEALAVARRNALRFAAEVHFRQVDIFSRKRLARRSSLAIVSNPPYVLESEKNVIQQQITRYEPTLALFVPDNDPLLYYKTIGKLSASVKGNVYFETHKLFAIDVANLMRKFGYREVNVYKDIFNNNRFVVAKF